MPSTPDCICGMGWAPEEGCPVHDGSVPAKPSIISDQEAARIADEWRDDHHGLDCLSLLADRGAIVEPVHRSRDEMPPPRDAGTTGLLRMMIREEYWSDEQGRRDLEALLAYVAHHGERGPQPGWGQA